MKKILIIGFLWITVGAQAQESQLHAFFDKYSGKEGVTSVLITEYMFDLFKSIETTEENEEFHETVSNLRSIKILSVDSALDANSVPRFHQDLRNTLSKKIYKEMMVVRDGDETVAFLLKEENNKITEFIMAIDDPSGPTLIILEGDIQLKQISKLSKTMNVSGLEHLEKVEKQ